MTAGSANDAAAAAVKGAIFVGLVATCFLMSGKKSGHETNELIGDIRNDQDTMQSLDLTEYHMSPQACDKITIALRKNTSIKEIYLNNCCIGDNGVIKFAEVISENPNIQVLCLFGNTVGDRGVESICTALRHNTALTSLDLRGNDIADDGAQYLSTLMKENATIEVLDVRSNPDITSQGVSALVGGLKANSTIQTFGVSAGRFSSTVQNLLRRNRKDKSKKEERIMHLDKLLASDRMSKEDYDAAVDRIHHPRLIVAPKSRSSSGTGSELDTHKSNMASALGTYYAKQSSNAIPSNADTSNNAVASKASYSVQDTLSMAFAEFDADNTGLIDSEELSNLLSALGYPMEGSDLDQLVLWLDKSGDGQISLEEFQAWWLSS